MVISTVCNFKGKNKLGRTLGGWVQFFMRTLILPVDHETRVLFSVALITSAHLALNSVCEFRHSSWKTIVLTLRYPVPPTSTRIARFVHTSSSVRDSFDEAYCGYPVNLNQLTPSSVYTSIPFGTSRSRCWVISSGRTETWVWCLVIISLAGWFEFRACMASNETSATGTVSKQLCKPYISDFFIFRIFDPRIST